MQELEEITGDVTIQQIATTEDTGDAVFRAESDNARMSFLFPTGREHDMLIHTVSSDEKGGMKSLLDAVCREYDCEYLRFSTPLSDQLPNALSGFEKVVETIEDGPMAGEPWECLDGTWNVD